MWCLKNFNFWLLANIAVFLPCLVIGQINKEQKEQVNRDLIKSYNFIYPNGGTERDLEKCASPLRSPCNLVTNPFFFPFLVTRLCRCPDDECPYTYEPKKSYDTVQLNNREQLKFCGEVPKCEKEEPSVLEVRGGVATNLTCFCPYKRRRWQLMSDRKGTDNKEIELFQCQRLPHCKASCGYLRLDLYATYYHCTCQTGKLCVPKSNTPVNIREILYKGKGLVSECTAFT